MFKTTSHPTRRTDVKTKTIYNAGDISGTRKERLGMVPKLLTDARETSYVILSSLLTAECSTIELPGNAQRACFHSITRNEIRHDLSVTGRMLFVVERRGSFAFCDGCAAFSSAGWGTWGTSFNLGKRMRPRSWLVYLAIFFLGGNLHLRKWNQILRPECRTRDHIRFPGNERDWSGRWESNPSLRICNALNVLRIDDRWSPKRSNW